MSEIFIIIELKTEICPWHMELYRSLFSTVENRVVLLCSYYAWLRCLVPCLRFTLPTFELICAHVYFQEDKYEDEPSAMDLLKECHCTAKKIQAYAGCPECYCNRCEG